jgi:23S rRNA (adenine2503-C2)-methyltransferase
LVRNLSSGESIAQLLHAKDALYDWPSNKEGRVVSNIVMMGMGEPFLNYDNVSLALKTAMDRDGLNMSRQKITISTSGIAPAILRAADDLGTNLAISLHATTDELRDQLVPINKKYKLSELLAACAEYARKTNDRRITFEYVMLSGVNDSQADARRLVSLISGIPSKINLIPFNQWPGSNFECSSDKAIDAFARIVENAGYQSPVRTPRGTDIMAACGQLKSASAPKFAYPIETNITQ